MGHRLGNFEVFLRLSLYKAWLTLYMLFGIKFSFSVHDKQFPKGLFIFVCLTETSLRALCFICTLTTLFSIWRDSDTCLCSVLPVITSMSVRSVSELKRITKYHFVINLFSLQIRPINSLLTKMCACAPG